MSVVVVLAGCMVGPDYRAPTLSELKVPAQFAAPAPAGTTARAEIVRWWRSFGDPTLAALVERGLAANLDIEQAGARVREARAQLRRARGVLLPSLDAFANESRLAGGARRISGGDRSTFQAGFDAAYEVDLFGGGRRSVQAARATAEGSEANLHAVQFTVASEVALNYMAAREAQAQLKIAHETLASLDETLDIVGWRLKAGLVSSLDLERARQLRAQTAATIPGLESSYAEAANRLAVLLGEPPGAVTALLEPAAPPPSAPAVVPAAIPADVVLRRPDVAVAERSLAAETARIGVEAARLYPALSLSGSLAGSGATLSKAVDNGFGELIAAISAPIFHGGQIRAAVEGQRAAAAAAAYRTSVLTALEDADNALTAISTAREREAQLAIAETAGRNAVDIAGVQYGSGQIDFQSLLDSERSLLVTQDALVSARVARDVAAVQLYKALGGGWQAAPEPSSVSAR